MDALNEKLQKLCINPDGTFTPYGIDLVNLFSNQLDKLAFVLNTDTDVLRCYLVNTHSPVNFESVRNELDIILCPVKYGNDYYFATNQSKVQLSKDFIIRNANIPSLSDWCAKIIKRLPKSYTPIIIDRDMHTAMKNKILKEIKQLKNFIWNEGDCLVVIINGKRIHIPKDIGVQICIMNDHTLTYQDMVSFLEDCVNELNNYIASYYKNNNTTAGD